MRDIKEINIPSYAHLTKATVVFSDMGEKTITSQIAIDGQITPNFSFDWELEFKGEKYIMPLRTPQASKENTSWYSKIDLTFQHWAIYQLKRWYFFTLQSYEAGVAVADQYIASVSLNLKNFCDLYGQMLKHYFDDKITIDLNPSWVSSEEPIYIDINYSYMWDVLIKLYELFAVRWEILPNGDIDHYVIKVGYPTESMNHVFEYGFEGGLLKVERQVQDDNIRNMLLGRGGDRNIPYRYFKKLDPDNPTFQADPDWVEELSNVYIDRLRSAEFRSYIQGWKAQHISKYPNYTPVGEYNSVVPWAYRKGYTDSKFNPVEYVRDTDSIRKYGELMGGLENNDEIYPSIQGVVIDPLGRIDQAIDVEQVAGDNLNEEKENEVASWSERVAGTSKRISLEEKYTNGIIILPKKITVPEGYVANINTDYIITQSMFAYNKSSSYSLLNISPLIMEQEQFRFEDKNVGDRMEGVGGGGAGGGSSNNDISKYLTRKSVEIVAIDENGNEMGASAIPQGVYEIGFKIELEVDAEVSFTNKRIYANISISNVSASFAPTVENQKNQATFDIWIKNIWQTTPNDGESAEAYAERVWKPILGNHLGDDAAVCFSSGFLSTSEDYTFLILGKAIKNGIHYDTSKSFNGVQSHWRLTLVRSKADYDSLGKLVPNLERQGKAGDYFYFTGIELTQYYVKWAENKLHNYKLEQLAKVSEIQPSWVVSLDKVRIGTPHYDDTVSLIEQLHIGSRVKIADKRFIGYGEHLYLYIQQITYKYNESANTANITPDTEIVLGTDYQTTANPVATIQAQIDAIQNQMGGYSIAYVDELVRLVGDRIYLRKDGLTDRSQSITYFTQLLAALGFRQGMVGGYGWGIYQDENGKWVIETDKLNVRDEMQVNTLVVNQIQARGGMIIESAASMEVSATEESSNAYKVYFDNKQGAIGNLFVVDDVAYCHRYTPYNNDLKYYKRRVIEVGEDYITLSKTTSDGQGVPSEGDVIVHFGNYTNKNRQYVIIRDVMGGGYERMLSGLDSVTAIGNEYYFAGYQSTTGERFFIGTLKDNQYIEYKDGKLYIPGQLILGSDVGDGKSMIDYIRDNIDKAQKDAEEYANAIIKAVGDDLQKQIDGQIETWYASGVPTINNYPANEWKTNNVKDIHIGDLYYDRDSGYAYRFMLEGSTYKWVLIQDTDIAKALATANSKRRIFTQQPTPPYDANDLWVNATYGTQYKDDILVCKSARLSGTFSISDWGLASDYIDNTDLTTWGNTFKNQFSQEIKSQLDGKAETWYQVTDPSTNWNAEQKKEHVGDLWFNTTNNTTWYWNGSEWRQQNVPDAVFDKIDGKADIYISKPSSYNANDLWFLESASANLTFYNGAKYEAGTLLVARQKSSTFVATHWEKKDRYTDDTTANKALNEIAGYEYLKKALIGGRTEVQNGLVLSSLIQLGTWNGSQQTVYSGINGHPLTASDDKDYIKKGLGIAAWYGGDMLDAQFNTSGRLAKSLFRFDGSGYLASGNIYWDSNGGLSLEGDVKLKTLRYFLSPANYPSNSNTYVDNNIVNDSFLFIDLSISANYRLPHLQPRECRTIKVVASTVSRMQGTNIFNLENENDVILLEPRFVSTTYYKNYQITENGVYELIGIGSGLIVGASTVFETVWFINKIEVQSSSVPLIANINTTETDSLKSEIETLKSKIRELEDKLK